jgi:hypothetical protein
MMELTVDECVASVLEDVHDAGLDSEVVVIAHCRVAWSCPESSRGRRTARHIVLNAAGAARRWYRPDCMQPRHRTGEMFVDAARSRSGGNHTDAGGSDRLGRRGELDDETFSSPIRRRDRLVQSVLPADLLESRG